MKTIRFIHGLLLFPILLTGKLLELLALVLKYGPNKAADVFEAGTMATVKEMNRINASR